MEEEERKRKEEDERLKRRKKKSAKEQGGGMSRMEPGGGRKTVQKKPLKEKKPFVVDVPDRYESDEDYNEKTIPWHSDLGQEFRSSFSVNERLASSLRRERQTMMKEDVAPDLGYASSHMFRPGMLWNRFVDKYGSIG